MAELRPTDDFNFQGAVTFSGGVTLPAGSVLNAGIGANAAIEVTKMRHRYKEILNIGSTIEVTAILFPVATIEAAGSIESFEVFPPSVPTPSPDTIGYSIDLEKSTGGSTFVSILAAALTIGASDTDKVIRAATITTSTLSDGDALQIRVLLTGSSGTQGKGMVATARWNESAA